MNRAKKTAADTFRPVNFLDGAVHQCYHFKKKRTLFFLYYYILCARIPKGSPLMNQNEIDLLNFENELLKTRKRLNDLIYQCSHSEQTPESKALCQEKIFYLETELKYMNQQFRMLKDRQNAEAAARQANSDPFRAQAGMMPQPGMAADIPPHAAPQTPQHTSQSFGNAGPYPAPGPVSPNLPRKDYEKLFGRSFMGIFASVLIFISLIIFATLMLPYLTDTMKLAGLYLLSFGLLTAGFVLSGKNPENKFYLAVIGCGCGSLYISLLLSDLYFKVFGDFMLYALILVWAVFVRYLARLKSLVFHIIGQLGILISMILGTALCVYDADAAKFLVLTVFYLISAFVFANTPLFRLPRRNAAEDSKAANVEKDGGWYALCNHIFRLSDVFILTIGTLFLDSVFYPGSAVLKTASIVLLLLFLLLEYFLFYRKESVQGIAFQFLTIAASCLFVCLLGLLTDWPEEVFPALVYVLSVILLFYITKKNTAYGIISRLFSFLLIWAACYHADFISSHLCGYLTFIPFLLYGGLRKDKTYLYAGVAFLFAFLPLAESPEHLIMVVLSYALFVYFASRTDDVPFSVSGYLALTLAVMFVVGDCSYTFLSQNSISQSYLKSELITFFVVAALHLALSKFQYLGQEKPVEIMTYLINGLLMAAGCILLYSVLWQIPVILITVLLFTVNSGRILRKDARAGYYAAFKYTLLMLCILGSYEVASYLISISLLLFAILSIVIGFYKNTTAFRLYGLVLSMVSVIKLIMFDIRYDSTLENAVSFFVCGLLCFVISFLYNRIDHYLKKK